MTPDISAAITVKATNAAMPLTMPVTTEAASASASASTPTTTATVSVSTTRRATQVPTSHLLYDNNTTATTARTSSSLSSSSSSSSSSSLSSPSSPSSLQLKSQSTTAVAAAALAIKQTTTIMQRHLLTIENLRDRVLESSVNQILDDVKDFKADLNECQRLDNIIQTLRDYDGPTIYHEWPFPVVFQGAVEEADLAQNLNKTKNAIMSNSKNVT
ncbi:uncharacterized protein DDB_G0280205 isoform X2 [Glossina fuscipes]|uniref:Uncharacterized protein DDB_G0280205 isoform X2 n=1 Tax=Glossina fuscipes TaxID=7396 RepID=A0A8U0W806_9MUSC|nr:uncharacterized protein DDB_G0280205 isoform X2 [Glossina fuscipes]